jgi:hypothetical protein
MGTRLAASVAVVTQSSPVEAVKIAVGSFFIFKSKKLKLDIISL